MRDDTGRLTALTDEQRRLVNDNIGLVAVHLRRYVPNLGSRRFDRDRDDLFQEGCLGLIRAAAIYRCESGIPFAAFALPRIHQAVSKALRSKFSTVYVPPHRARLAVGDEACDEPALPRVVSLSGPLGDRLYDRRSSRTNPEADCAAADTVGERLREKYERAVRAACDAVGRGSSTRGDRAVLARMLIEERLLVPYEEARRPLRQIARDTHSSFARVSQCEKQLGEKVRDILDADPEFHELRQWARAEPFGDERPIDGAVERRLADAGAVELVRRYRSADPATKARVIHDVLDLSAADIEGVIRERFQRMSPMARRRVLAEAAPPRRAARRHDPR